jgi:phosphoserine phosphatase RsbU/P
MNEKTIHILLVEDNPGDARLLREMLHDTKPIHFEFIWVDRLAKGLDRLATGGIDVALVDLSLPDASGLDTVVRTRQAAPDLPIIVLTGSVDSERGITAVREGAQDYLMKGRVDSELIVRTIRYAIERKRTERELARYARELREKNDQMRADLQLANEIQMALLPQTYPTFPHGVPPAESGLRFHHHYHPAAFLAGDFFDVLALSDTAAGVFICDVMGHGVRAALITSMIRALVEELTPVATEPGLMLKKINQGLMDILRQADTTIFATACYLVADVAQRKFSYANAGHPHPIHLRGDTAQWLNDANGTGPALGLFDTAEYPTITRPMEADDVVLLYTDGLFEARNKADEEYGQQRLLEAARRHHDVSPTNLIIQMVDDVQRFAGRRDFDDDVCVISTEIARLR